MAKQIEKTVVRLVNPVEEHTFYGLSTSKAHEGVVIFGSETQTNSFPIHRLRDIITTLEDSE